MTMAPIILAAVLLPPAAATSLMVMMVLQLSAAAAPPPRVAPIGQPGCDTTCGDVSVPYPLGIGSSRCYWPGLNLTCDRSHRPPRLLLGDGTLRVTGISLENGTVRVVRSGSIINATAADGLSNASVVSFGRSFTEHGYMLHSGNELLVFGCNVVATVLADDIGRIGGCASFCAVVYSDGDFVQDTSDVRGIGAIKCDGTSGCCRSPVAATLIPPDKVEAKRLYGGGSGDGDAVEQMQLPVNVFVAEEGWIDELRNASVPAYEAKEVPFLLQWNVARGGLPETLQDNSGQPCDEGVRRMLCKSEHSHCSTTNQGYMCQCEDGYQGNPYLAGGCQDIDECKLPREKNGCFGECINTIGSMECQCPRGTFGMPGVKGGCVKMNSTDELLPTPVGLGNCSTACGDVQVPYPFGFGPSHCYRPGLNLTCDTSHHPARLLLDGNAALQVVGIFLHDSTVRVVHHTHVFASDFTYANDNVTEMANLPDMGESYLGQSYMLSDRNEFLFFGYGVQATLYSSSSSNVTGCVSTSTFSSSPLEYRHCSGSDACCHTPVAAGSMPKKIEFKPLVNTSATLLLSMPLAFILEEGLTAQWWNLIVTRSPGGLDTREDHFFSSPLVLQWAVKPQGFSAPAVGQPGRQCPGDVASDLCRSKDSSCRQENGGFTCHCNTGYQGNPYIDGGCLDIDECTITRTRCFGVCENIPGNFKCRCPRGKFGNASAGPNGCVTLSTILSRFIRKNKIGLSAASGPVLLLLVLSATLIPRKLEQHRTKVLRQKYFKQNRGQLLQQLMSQKADIAERMIIPLDELAKATNNFDKSRELGGGGHGTVYKGILSDLHVVAIKKSNIAVQKEIYEFINEVAILSQVNHKNVVKLFGCCLETKVPLLVYEFISNGTLYHHLHVEGPRSLSWSNRLRIAAEIATSLAYLHSAVSIPIIHRDIKSSNILLDDTLTSKVSDFGASRYIPNDKTGLTTRVQGTRGYLDPVYFQTNRLTEKSDVYSFGVILVELLTRKKPFSYLSAEGDSLVFHFLELLAEGNLVQILDPHVTEEGGEEVQEVARLAGSCINLRGDERPTMQQVAHTLEGLWGSKKYMRVDTVAEELENQAEGQGIVASSRIYSLEQEMMMSAEYPR